MSNLQRYIINNQFNRFDLIDSLLEKGYVGNGYDAQRGVIQFVNENRLNEMMLVARNIRGNCYV